MHRFDVVRISCKPSGLQKIPHTPSSLSPTSLQVQQYVDNSTEPQSTDVAALFVGVNDYLHHQADPEQV